jgi:hypothetical protein
MTKHATHLRASHPEAIQYTRPCGRPEAEPRPVRPYGLPGLEHSTDFARKVERLAETGSLTQAQVEQAYAFAEAQAVYYVNVRSDAAYRGWVRAMVRLDTLLSTYVSYEDAKAAMPTQATINARISHSEWHVGDPEPYFRSFYTVNGKRYFRWVNALKAAYRMGK